ncbi:hypothetical protein ASPWEDRAFT_42681 [Aspergillus wentii DTO 134E9]|uniref:DSBA-like thioredoxin domain-containing protein n=1 Tax=Aspergillus wentii DTO 134E9 TaxID=1073089 RepID=A0A1L9RCS3_ASPWE|nr:uncharacterized protein ASPWEDRAFT_42681 [Aspergillus wentii DTO 134E9]OJJ32667.1 hypothetical protein ASPWEDRAFT_42681 [Aspergillus wentii DTO 134E9]
MVILGIDVISDIVCAWCYIGKRRLDRAIALYRKTYPGGRDDVFQITWRPYYLDYNTSSPDSIEKSELAEKKLAGMRPEQRTALTQRMSQLGRSVGINFKWGGRIGSTRDAHRLIHLSQTKSEDITNALVEKLFEAYHELERDISSRELLFEIAVDAGLDASEVEEYLNGSGSSTVDEEAQKNKETFGSVPVFIIQGIRRLEGAQESTDFMEIFAQVKDSGSS